MRDVLYLALLLHDVAKGRGGDHSEIGAGIAREVATRLAFTPDEVETVAWLVRWHLLFSMTAFKRDPNDPRTIDDFVGQVRSLERLRLLLVLTAADITAVGPGRMTAWKASLLRMLYHRAEAVLAGGREAEDREERVAKARQKLRARLEDWPEDDIADFEARLPVTYWLSTDSAMQERHARLVRGGGRGPLIETRIDRARDATEMTLYTPDYIGLFAAIAGAMATSGVNIVDARVYTTSDGMAVDTIWIQAQTVARSATKNALSGSSNAWSTRSPAMTATRAMPKRRPLRRRRAPRAPPPSRWSPMSSSITARAAATR